MEGQSPLQKAFGRGRWIFAFPVALVAIAYGGAYTAVPKRGATPFVNCKGQHRMLRESWLWGTRTQGGVGDTLVFSGDAPIDICMTTGVPQSIPLLAKLPVFVYPWVDRYERKDKIPTRPERCAGEHCRTTRSGFAADIWFDSTRAVVGATWYNAGRFDKPGGRTATCCQW